MDVRQLSALLAVADHGSFTAAAAALSTVQSNVSAHVARLEREIGAPLVDRGSGLLTAEGELVVARGRRIVAEIEAAAGDVAALRDEVRGEVRLGVISTTARWLVTPLLAEAEKRHAHVCVVVLEASTTSLALQLSSGRLDLAVVNLPLPEPDLTGELLFEEDLVVAVPAGHPLARRGQGDGKRRTMRLRDIAGHPLLLPPRGTALREELETAAAGDGLTLVARAEVDGIGLLASLVTDGVGPAVLPATAIERARNSAWEVVALRDLPRREVGLAVRRHSPPSAQARAVASLIRDVVTAHAARQGGVRVPPG
jgi:LysR family hydrogen peroxide-inducible transcriptional activator